MPNSTVLLVVPQSAWADGGNWVTARRIVENVAASGWRGEVLSADLVAARVAQGGVGVLHAIHACKSGIEVARVAHHAGLPYVVTCSGTDLATDIRRPDRRRAMRLVVRGACALTTFHHSAAEVATAALPEAQEHLWVIPPGIGELPGSRNRARFGLAEDEFVFVLPAGVRAVKRPTYAIAPLQRLRRRFPRLRLLIAGPVLEEEAGRRLEQARSGRPWVDWPGSVPREAMGSLYRSADVVLNTSRHEGLSNAVMEAMRIGRPLLLADNPGNREAAADTALYFRNQREFLEASERLLSDAMLARRLAHAARERAARVFSPEREAAFYANLYERARAGAEAAAAGRICR